MEGFLDEDWDADKSKSAEAETGARASTVPDVGGASAGPDEGQSPKFKCIPCMPTQSEIHLHDLSHLPYRNWCPICVRSKAKEDPHRRHPDGHNEEHGLPIISMDYELLEDKEVMLVVKDEVSGAVLAYDCTCKGPGDEWVPKQLARDLDAWGRKDICLKTDGEPAIMAVQREVAKLRSGRTVPLNPPACDPHGNGPAEKAVQDVTGHLRCVKLALEAKLKRNIDASHPIVKWMMPHAAFLLTRLSVGRDGMTSWRRLMGKTWNGSLAEVGELVWAKLQLKKPSIEKKHKRAKKKLVERSILGVWLGVYARTGEHIVLKENGDVVRVRTINRRPEGQRFNADMITSIEATPRRPTPSARRPDGEIEGQLLGEEGGGRRPREPGARPQPDH